MLVMLGDEKHTHIRESQDHHFSHPSNQHRSEEPDPSDSRRKIQAVKKHGSFFTFLISPGRACSEPHTHFWPPEYSKYATEIRLKFLTEAQWKIGFCSEHFSETSRINKSECQMIHKIRRPNQHHCFPNEFLGDWVGNAKHPHRINGLKYSTICPKNTSISPCKLDWKGLVPVDPTRRSTIIWNMLKHVGNLPKKWEIWEVSKLNWSFLGFFFLHLLRTQHLLLRRWSP